MKTTKTKVPLEVILPDTLQKQIKEAVKMFTMGVTWHIEGSSNFTLRLGHIYLTGFVAEKDDYVYVLICQEVEEYYGVPIEDILSKSTRYYYEKRQILQVLAEKHTRLSLREIARRTGKKGHCAIYHSKKTILNLISTNQVIAQQYHDINERVKTKLGIQ